MSLKPSNLDQAVFGTQPVRNQVGTPGILLVFISLSEEMPG
jgi:hypothetical protein